MGFAIVQDAFCAKMTAFVYGVSVPGVTLARKPNCTNAEFGLYDIWFHRMEFKVPCLEGDWPEFLAALQKDETDRGGGSDYGRISHAMVSHRTLLARARCRRVKCLRNA